MPSAAVEATTRDMESVGHAFGGGGGDYEAREKSDDVPRVTTPATAGTLSSARSRIPLLPSPLEEANDDTYELITFHVPAIDLPEFSA